MDPTVKARLAALDMNVAQISLRLEELVEFTSVQARVQGKIAVLLGQIISRQRGGLPEDVQRSQEKLREMLGMDS